MLGISPRLAVENEWNIAEIIHNADYVNGPKVLDDNDGARIGLAIWDFDCCELLLTPQQVARLRLLSEIVVISGILI